MLRRIIAVIFVLFSPGLSSADPLNPVEVTCGGRFSPTIEAAEGRSGPVSLGQLYANPGKLEVVHPPTARAGGYNSYNQFCNPGDAALTAVCTTRSKQAAIDAAIEACERAAIAKGKDDTQYRCKREDCAAGSPGCVKHATDANCSVLVPQLQCKCGVDKQLDNPTAQSSTVSCMCDCVCTADGSADMQCTNCDGTCVKTTE